MTRTDSLVVGTLVVMLAILAGLVGVPALAPPPRQRPTPSQSSAAGRLDPVVSRRRPRTPRSRSARCRRGRRPTATSSRSSSRGSSATARPGRWCPTSPSAGRSTRPASCGPSSCATTRCWHDGEPVTAEDVAFTIRVLQDPTYHGPAAGSWNEVTRRGDRATDRDFTLKTPLGGFLQAATQPIAPAHLLGRASRSPSCRITRRVASRSDPDRSRSPA